MCDNEEYYLKFDGGKNLQFELSPTTSPPKNILSTSPTTSPPKNILSTSPLLHHSAMRNPSSIETQITPSRSSQPIDTHPINKTMVQTQTSPIKTSIKTQTTEPIKKHEQKSYIEKEKFYIVEPSYNSINYRKLYDWGINYIPSYYTYDQRKKIEYLFDILIRRELYRNQPIYETERILKNALDDIIKNNAGPSKAIQTKLEEVDKIIEPLKKKSMKKSSKKKSMKKSPKKKSVKKSPKKKSVKKSPKKKSVKKSTKKKSQKKK
jgi:hypothetical protein